MNYPGGHCQGWQTKLGSQSLQPPANKQPYQKAGTEPPSPMDRIYPSLLSLFLRKDSTPLGEGEERLSTNPLLEITIQQRSWDLGCESLQAP